MATDSIQIMNSTRAFGAALASASATCPKTRKVWFMSPSVDLGHEVVLVERERGEVVH